MKFSPLLQLVVAVLICELAGIIGSVFTVSEISGWYGTLVKPALNPPSSIFGPVWTTLYLLMGVAVFLVWRMREKKKVNVALFLFGFQLVLNTFWSIIFFGWHNPLLALVDITFLWISIVATIISFYKISRPSAFLLVPYLLWVSFATYLNYALWVLNK
jgi:tryptophan-rich sensory protein